MSNKLLISFSGAQSTGKTTLLNHLKERNDHVNFVSEVTRLIKREYGVDINEAGDEMTQSLIITEHFKNINNHKKQENSSILDRCILDGLIYTEWLEVNQHLQEWCRDYAFNVYNRFINEYDIIFYTNASDVKIEDDGERSIDTKFRNNIITAFGSRITNDTRLRDRVVILRGTVEERLQTIKTALAEKGLDINI